MLKLKEISKIYGDGTKALDEVEVEIKEGGGGKGEKGVRQADRFMEPLSR